MLTGEGTPLNILNANVQSVRDYAHSTSLNAKNDSTDRSGQTGLSDLVELSKEARNFLDNSRNLLNTLAEGQQDLSRQERDFLSDRLEQLQEQIGFLQSLISVATPEQASTILKGLEDAGNTLQGIGRQLGLVNDAPKVESTGERVEIQAVNLSASFNQVAVYQTENGDTYAVSQSLQINFSFLQGTVSSRQSAEAAEAGQALTAEGNGNSANALFLAQLNTQNAAARKTSAPQRGQASIFEAVVGLSSGASANVSLEAVEQFSQVVHSLTQTIKEFEEVFTDEDRVPPSLYSIIKNLLSLTLDNKPSKDNVEKVDKVA